MCFLDAAVVIPGLALPGWGFKGIPPAIAIARAVEAEVAAAVIVLAGCGRTAGVGLGGTDWAGAGDRGGP